MMSTLCAYYFVYTFIRINSAIIYEPMLRPRCFQDATVTTPSASRIARGGKAVHGAPLGILMLDTRFPRILGDMGNAHTWPFPVLYRVVHGASAEKIVLQDARDTLSA